MAWYDPLFTELKKLVADVATDVKGILPRLLPGGGAAGQVLTKAGAANYLASWQTLSLSPTRSITLTDAGGNAVGIIEVATDPASPYVQAIHIRPLNSGQTRLYLGSSDNPLYSVKFFANLLESLPGFTFANALSLGQDGGISINRMSDKIVIHSGGGAGAGVDFSTNPVDYGIAGATNSTRKMRLTAAGRLLLQDGGGDGSTFADDGTNILQAKGTIKAYHLAGGTATPTFITGTGAGPSPTVTIKGTDTAGTISITTGSGTVANQLLIRLTFNQPFATAPFVLLGSGNATTAAVGLARVFVDSTKTTATTFELTTGSTPLVGGTTYVFTYQVIQ